MSRKTVLVTGGAGFIGSCLAKRLIAEGCHVVVVDNLFTGKQANLPDAADFVEGDIGRPETLSRLPDLRYDAVCHLAAQSSGAISMEQPLYDIQTNAVSTLLLVRWCEQHKISKFLYASSMAVYGNPTALPVAEETSPVPVSYYGVSKYSSENILRVACSSGLSATALRMFNVYGPGQNMTNLRQGMASIYLAYLLAGRELPVTGSLERFRDFVYIDDVVEAWMAAMGREKSTFSVYNIGSGEPTKVRELLRLLLVACKLPANYCINELPAPSGDQFGLYADVRRAARELGWRSTMPLDVGIARMVKWAQSQSNA